METIVAVLEQDTWSIAYWMVPVVLLLTGISFLTARNRTPEGPNRRARTGLVLLVGAAVAAATVWQLHGLPLQQTRSTSASLQPKPAEPSGPPPALHPAPPPPAPPASTSREPARPPSRTTQAERTPAASIQWSTDAVDSTPTSGVDPACAMARADLLINNSKENFYQRDIACGTR